MASYSISKSFIAFFIVLLIASSLRTSAQPAYKNNAILYEISGKDLEKPSYVFAILKFIPKKDYYFPKVAMEKFNQSDILSTETLLDHHAKHELNKAAHLDNNQSLTDIMSEADFNKLEGIFVEQLGVKKMKFELLYGKFKPIMLSTTMTRLALKEDLKYYEPELIILAEKNDKLIMGLETIEREVEALDKFAIEDQVDALLHTMDNLAGQVSDYKEIVTAYKAGDLHKTLEYTLHPVESNESFKQNFIIDRNKEWVPKMVEYMHQAPTFFAIGATHVADENGLIDLLEQEGYTIKALK